MTLSQICPSRLSYTQMIVYYMKKISSVEDQIRLNENFAKVISWCDKWQMSINFEKTVFMRITKKSGRCCIATQQCFTFGSAGIQISRCLDFKQPLLVEAYWCRSRKVSSETFFLKAFAKVGHARSTSPCLQFHYSSNNGVRSSHLGPLH